MFLVGRAEGGGTEPWNVECRGHGKVGLETAVVTPSPRHRGLQGTKSGREGNVPASREEGRDKQLDGEEEPVDDSDYRGKIGFQESSLPQGFVLPVGKTS